MIPLFLDIFIDFLHFITKFIFSLNFPIPKQFYNPISFLFMTELKKTIAFLFKRKSRDVIPEKDLKLSISFELHWFSPQDADDLLLNAIKQQLLLKTEQGLRPNFDYKKEEIPFGFRPTKQVLEFKERDIFLEIIEKIAQKGKNKEEIMNEIMKKQELLNVNVEVSALIYAKECNVDISEFYDEVEKRIVKTE